MVSFFFIRFNNTFVFINTCKLSNNNMILLKWYGRRTGFPKIPHAFEISRRRKLLNLKDIPFICRDLPWPSSYIYVYTRLNGRRSCLKYCQVREGHLRSFHTLLLTKITLTEGKLEWPVYYCNKVVYIIIQTHVHYQRPDKIHRDGCMYQSVGS